MTPKSRDITREMSVLGIENAYQFALIIRTQNESCVTFVIQRCLRSKISLFDKRNDILYYTLQRQRKQTRLALALTLITDFPVYFKYIF